MSWMRCYECGALRKFGNVVDTRGGEYVQACPECDHAAYYIEPPAEAVTPTQGEDQK